MTDEVGPNDPNRGRSSIGGFKLPNSTPIYVRDIEDIRDAGWGGLRKPKRTEEREPAPSDLTGGGYTAVQTNNERGRLLLLFLGGPIAFLALVGLIGWLVMGRPVEPIESSCGPDGYTAVYARSDFHREANSAVFDVGFNGESFWRSGDSVRVVFFSDTETVEVIARPSNLATVTSCEVVRITLAE